MFDGALWDFLLFLLIVWATTGLTFVHLGVLLARSLRPRRRAPASAAAPLDRLRTLTFIIPVYNDEKTIGPAIESLLRQTIPPDRILVVDDGSTDGTPAAVDAYQERGVDVIHLPRNVGKTHALDAALRTVTTELVAITDADSIVDARYVEEMQRSFQDPDLAAVGGAVESIPHTWVTAARQIEYMLTVKIDRDAESTMNALIVLPGVSTTYRTAVLREMGFEFDTIAEDFDLTFRLQRAGRKIAMNLRAKVWTSDPPTLAAYWRQLTRWYTDMWLVLKKHRKVLGKRVFGTVEVPLLVLNATVSSVLYLVLPAWFAWKDPQRLVSFALTGLAMDVVLVALAWRLYRRHDVWWALLSRTPTRFLGRVAYLTSMTRVLVGRPGMAWTKLERRGTDAFLVSSSKAAAPARRARRRDVLGGGVWWAALLLVLVGGATIQLVPLAWALMLLGLGATILLLRGVGRALARAGRSGPRIAWLVGAEVAFLAAAAWAFGFLPLGGPVEWRVVALALGAQIALAPVVALRPGPPSGLVAVGHASILAVSAAILLGLPLLVGACAYAGGFTVLALAVSSTRADRVVGLAAATAAAVACGLMLAPHLSPVVTGAGAGAALAAGGLGLALLSSPPWSERQREPEAEPL